MRNLMICCLRLNDPDGAVATARSILAIDPNQADARMLLQQFE
jgi:hypothetical protein